LKTKARLNLSIIRAGIGMDNLSDVLHFPAYANQGNPANASHFSAENRLVLPLSLHSGLDV
jgi:hypothetical protein